MSGCSRCFVWAPRAIAGGADSGAVVDRVLDVLRRPRESSTAPEADSEGSFHQIPSQYV